MPATLLRVVNKQTLRRSILLDKIDRSQGNFEGYALRAKQKLYVPYVNPLDTSVNGYVDLVPTDEVLLQAAPKGAIAGLVAAGRVTMTAFSSSLTVAPAISSAANAAGVMTIGGTTFLSLLPDVTYVTLTNTGGSSQVISQSNFSVQTTTQIQILDGVVTIGVPGVGWKAKVQANSKVSNIFTL